MVVVSVVFATGMVVMLVPVAGLVGMIAMLVAMVFTMVGLSDGQSAPVGGIAPCDEGGGTAEETGADAADRHPGGGLTLSGSPVSAENLDGEPDQGEQPGDAQQPL